MRFRKEQNDEKKEEKWNSQHQFMWKNWTKIFIKYLEITYDSSLILLKTK